MGIRKLFCALGLLLLAYLQPTLALAEATLVRVIDGDTVVMTEDGLVFKLRLRNIDAPELHQAYGRRAQQSLNDWCQGATRVAIVGKDRYQRNVGDLFCHEEDAGLYQVTQGMAWAGQRLRLHHPLKQAQQEAQQQARGLWLDADPMPPWLWRRQVGRDDRFKN